jgi:arylsulfatase A-like enzyme
VRGRLASQVSWRAIDFIEANKAQPFFLFLNFYDPHLPFSDPDGLAAMFFPGGRKAYPVPRRALTHEEQAAYYDGEIRYMDRFLGRIFERLKALDLYDQTWIIVTADHGELLGEKHGVIGHGKSLYEGEIRIPMILKYPYGEVAPGRSDRYIQLTDVAPMVAKRLVPSKSDAMPASKKSIDVFAEVYPSHLKFGEKDWLMLVSAPYKLLSSSTGELLLFNLDSDPVEEKNLSEADAARVAKMRASLEAFMAELPKASAPKVAGEVDEDLRRALESLGYLE